MSETNWAGNITYSARKLHRPSSVEELQEIVSAAPKLHVLGSRHTFNAIADAAELISLAGLPRELGIDAARRTVSVPADMRYGELAPALDAAGLALHNMASLPHVSVAGAVATGTHGSGDRNGNLATAVSGLDLVTSSGDQLHFTRGDPDFDGVVVNLGALGVVTRLTLDVEPACAMRQMVYEHLPWRVVMDQFDRVMSSGYSVSLFTTWADDVDQVWVKTRIASETPPDPPALFGAPAAQVDLHPVRAMESTSCTTQRGVPGPWWQRLTHFRVEFTPSVGDELQSEYMVAHRHAVPVIDVLRGLADRIQPLLLTSEIRTVAADTLWLSPEYARDSVCFHFTWQRNQPAVEALLRDLEAALSPYEPRPHWGKLFMARSDAIAPRYERLPDYLRLVERLDPQGTFTNAWFTANVRGEA